MSVAETKGVPTTVEAITPFLVQFPLLRYSENGVLFPTKESKEACVLDSQRIWWSVPDDKLNTTPPTVLVVDFDGITTVVPEDLRDGLIGILGNCTGKTTRPVYSVFDKLEWHGKRSPFAQFDQALEGSRDTKPVMVARRNDGEMYELIGNQEKINRFREAFVYLSQKDGWINGMELSRTLANINILHEMNRNGVILQHNASSGRAYFRRLI